MDKDHHRDCYVIKGFGKHGVGHARLLPRQSPVAASATIFSIFFLRTGLYGNSFYRLFYDTLMVGLNSAIIH